MMRQLAVVVCLAASCVLGGAFPGNVAEGSPWPESLVTGFGTDPAEAVAAALHQSPDDRQRLEIVADWIAQDGLQDGDAAKRIEAIGRVVESLGSADGKLVSQRDALIKSKTPGTDARWAELYLAACETRRAARFAPHREKMKRIVFAKHYDMGGSHYAYTEGQSDAQRERHFQAGTALCVLEMNDLYGTVRALVDDPAGVIRDPDVSYDGRRVLFAWKKSLNEDDYHLYEMSLADGQIRQITEGLGFADYEGIYLPNGDLLFNSNRCVQIVDCWWTEVSNLYTCDGDGKYLRQLSFDQVHTNYPTVTDDGRIIYTRWDYNDRGQIYPQGLFQAKPDGTGQTEMYGNNSFFPTTILHARSIPGTGKIVSVFSGHHSRQKGQLGILDPRKGRQENQGAQLIAPVRDTPAVHVDSYGQQGDQFQYPYPLSETEFLVTFKTEKAPRFGVYFMTIDGHRELLASDPKVSCNQSLPLAARPVPPVRPSLVDYRQDTGTIYLHNVYAGPGLAGVPRGTIKALRVVALDFRAAGVGNNGNSGPAGGAMISTPISIQGAWDVKKVLGTAKVHDDGSACFTVPARTPVYFQPLDKQGQMVQSMRSWVSLQPGETVSCVGCHEHKNTAPPVTGASVAMSTGPQPLKPFYGPARGFSFIREVQPVLDRRCVSCHDQDKPPTYVSAPEPQAKPYDPAKVAVLAACEGVQWRFTLKKPDAHWTKPDFDDGAWSYGPGGFGTNGTPGARLGTQWTSSEIWIRRTFELPKGAKPGRPMLLVHHDEDVEIYLNGVRAAGTGGYVSQYGLMPLDARAAATLKPGKNTLAVSCRQTGGGQFIDVGIVDTQPGATLLAEKPPEEPAAEPAPPAGIKPAFSLRGIQTLDGGAQRKWSDSYHALANRKIANWTNAQSAPPMLPPYNAGASQSHLIEMLRSGDHYGVKLPADELDRLIVWIDLLVPYVGDYTEAMNENQLPFYNRFLDKRLEWQAQEARNIEQYLREQR